MLALLGSGEYLTAVDGIDQYLISRLPEPARVVCLPTAAGLEGDQVIDSWMSKGIQHFNRLGTAVSGVRIHDKASAHDLRWVEMIQQANFVYLSGGNPGYLADVLEDSPAWEAILAVHQRGGVVAGCSAGAMIMGEKIQGPMGGRAGFNLLPGRIIIPHFNEFPGILSRIMRLVTDKAMTIVGIDGLTALVVEGDHFSVVGASQVTIIGNARTRHFSAGPLPADAF